MEEIRDSGREKKRLYDKRERNSERQISEYK